MKLVAQPLAEADTVLQKSPREETGVFFLGVMEVVVAGFAGTIIRLPLWKQG